MGMIRKVKFQVNGEWRDGVIHTYTEGKAVVEQWDTGEIHLIVVSPANLKYECKIEEWARIQQEAQQKAMAAQVLAVPPGVVNRFPPGRG